MFSCTRPEKPVILRDLMARFGFAAAQMLFIGDGLSDYKAAAAVETAFLARDTAALAATWREKAVRKAPDLRALPAIIDSWAEDWHGEWPGTDAGANA